MANDYSRRRLLQVSIETPGFDNKEKQRVQTDNLASTIHK